MQSDAYYCPPAEWSLGEVRQRYARLAGSYKVGNPLSLDYPYTSDLVNLKHALRDISAAVSNRDEAAIEIAIEFVLSDVFFHYSGYIRATMARRLKSAGLSETANGRLRRGLYKLLSSGRFGPEYREFARLLRSIGLGSMEDEYRTLLRGDGKQRVVARELFGGPAVRAGNRRPAGSADA